MTAFESLLGRFLPHLTRGAVVTECCPVVGAIGLVGLVHRRLGRLVASNVHAAAAAPFCKSASALPAHLHPAASLVVGSGGELANLLGGAHVAIVDTPRRGLDAPLLDDLAEAPGRA